MKIQTQQFEHTPRNTYTCNFVYLYIYIRLYTWALVNGYMGTGNFEMRHIIDNAISTTKYKPTHVKTHHETMKHVFSDIYIKNKYRYIGISIRC
jgi:hypothetical protein